MNKYDAYTTALWYLDFAKITHHPRYDEFEAALKKAGVVAWSLDDEIFRQHLLGYFGGEFKTIFPDKTQNELDSTVPVGVIDAFMPQVKALHEKQKGDVRKFSHELVNNFVSVEARNLIEATIEEKLPRVIRDKSTLRDVETEIHKIVTDTLAESGRPVNDNEVRQAIEAVRPTTINLMVTPRVFAQTTTAAVVDKKSYETILTQLIKETPTISIARHAVRAETLVRTLEATNATTVGADTARATGQLLITFAQQSKKPLGVAVASLLSPQTRDRIFDAIAARSWEQAVDRVTKKAAILALDQNILQDIVRRGNEAFGISTGKSGAVAARGFAEALWGNIAGPMENHIINQYDLVKLSVSLPQRQTNSAELFMILLYAQGSSAVTMRGKEQKEGGGLIGFLLSWGTEEGAARLINKGVTTVAGGTVKEVVKKGVTSFVTKILTKLGLSALAGVIAPGIGTVIAVVVQAAVWLGGFIVRPLWNLAQRFFRGEIGPWELWSQGLSSYIRGALGAVGETAKQWYDNPMIMLPVIIIVVIMLPVLPLVGPLLTPTQQITTQNAALLVSYDKALNLFGSVDLDYDGPFPNQVGLITGCPTAGRITQGPFGGKSHGNVDAYDFGAPWNSPVYATHDGIVATAVDGYAPWFYCDTRNCSFGNVVIIAGTGPGPNDHYTTTYAHLLTVAVSQGQQVEAGKTLLGYVDATGYTFDENGNPGGTHLHYQYNGPGRLELPAGCGM